MEEIVFRPIPEAIPTSTNQSLEDGVVAWREGMLAGCITLRAYELGAIPPQVRVVMALCESGSEGFPQILVLRDQCD